VWGVPNGPYLVIPVLGPSTIRDTGGLAVDSLLTPTWYFLDAAVTVGSRVVETVNTRAIVLQDVERARDASFDFYSAVRSAYLQHRETLLRDRGEANRESDDTLYYPDETKP
jgi:phospholipid-binding lipoprotein MlaA